MHIANYIGEALAHGTAVAQSQSLGTKRASLRGWGMSVTLLNNVLHVTLLNHECNPPKYRFTCIYLETVRYIDA